MKINHDDVGVAALSSFILTTWKMHSDSIDTVSWIPHKLIDLLNIIPFTATPHVCWRPHGVIVHIYDDREKMLIRTSTRIYELDTANAVAPKLFGSEVTRAIYPYATFYVLGLFPTLSI